MKEKGCDAMRPIVAATVLDVLSSLEHVEEEVASVSEWQVPGVSSCARLVRGVSGP